MMVQFSSSEDRRRTGDKFPVKFEVEDSLADEHQPVMKKQKQSSACDQFTAGNALFPAQPAQYNPLDEPSPLGLRLRKSPSLLELIQMRLSQGKPSSLGPSPSNDLKNQEKANAKNVAAAAVAVTDKLKASNFPATLLRIGSWEYTSRYEGDLVAKCYFAKHKLVWEVLDGGLKSKIEIQWSDIMGLKADMPDDEPATLTVMVSRQPLFFRETNPQPRKHTLWQAAPDFTDGQASLHRKHFLRVPSGLLNKHFEKLIQCDVRLNYLSQQPEVTLESPYFESQPSIINETKEFKSHGFNQRENSLGTTVSIFEDIATPSVSQSSSISFKLEDALHGSTEILSREATSRSAEMDMRATEASTSIDTGELKKSKSFEQLIIQGLRPSMSMADLMNHIEDCMSFENLSLPDDGTESHQILEDIAQHLLGDFNFSSCSDEKNLMSRVNSLCTLIHKDGTPVTCFEAIEDGTSKKTDQSNDKADASALEGDTKDVSGNKRVPSLPKIDSFGDLLLQLPRIASLPKFLFDISEDGDNQAR